MNKVLVYLTRGHHTNEYSTFAYRFFLVMTVFIGTKYSSDCCILYKISATGKLPVSVPCFLVAYFVWVDVHTPIAHAERYVHISF